MRGIAGRGRLGSPGGSAGGELREASRISGKGFGPGRAMTGLSAGHIDEEFRPLTAEPIEAEATATYDSGDPEPVVRADPDAPSTSPTYPSSTTDNDRSNLR